MPTLTVNEFPEIFLDTRGSGRLQRAGDGVHDLATRLIEKHTAKLLPIIRLMQ